MVTVTPFIPQNITVHLGSPSSNAPNITVPFIDYVKNVASSEIYPTWEESALTANILAIISFALNRVYTEF
ncbi:MAG: spore cortex-lytic protein, partial [Clostridia bacterium]|nr:spore cortex-lytic protein [Clostridia bacterium]